MAWLGRVSLGGFPDLAGAVTKLSESVKNIEKNFDSALGLESSTESSGEASGLWQSASEKISLFEPVMSFVGHKSGETSTSEVSNIVRSPEIDSWAEKDVPSSKEPAMPASDVVVDDYSHPEAKTTALDEVPATPKPDSVSDVHVESHEVEAETKVEVQAESNPSVGGNLDSDYSDKIIKPNEVPGLNISRELYSEKFSSTLLNMSASNPAEDSIVVTPDVVPMVNDDHISLEKQETVAKEHSEEKPHEHDNAGDDGLEDGRDTRIAHLASSGTMEEQSSDESPEDNSSSLPVTAESEDLHSESLNRISNSSIQSLTESETKDLESSSREPPINLGVHVTDTLVHVTDTLDYAAEMDKVNKEMKMMEAALQGAAKQAQAKADEIAKLMNENEQLKSTIENLKIRSAEADNEALREEYHQRVSSLERKVYALTKERDTLRREQSKKSDVAALLKEKDEIINQVMAEGENLSKKQATQESTIRKLRAQIRELEEEKQKMNSKLQVEETKVESIKKDKAATEKLLQETIEKNQADMAAQKEFYVNALNAAKEAEALAEARANNEAKVELEIRLREAAEREAMLVQTLEELRQTLTRTERQAAFKEDMLQRDINDLQQRYQASELRYNELITQVPESTRPLLRQIEAMQEAAARKAEAWAGVEKNLNSRLEAAEARAAASEEKERLINDRLSQALSRITVLETQIACLRTEQAQLNRSLEKERQRASESRQEYLAAMEEVATHEGRAKQLEDEIRELRTKHRQELQEELMHRELLEKELEQSRASIVELQRNSRQGPSLDQAGTIKHSRSYPENGILTSQKASSSGSLSSIEESFFLQASLDSSESSFDKKTVGEPAVSPYFLKSMTPSAFEAALRQKDGELASYMSRLASLESIRDSLAEELVKMTAQCEKLREEAALLPGVRAELDALRRRHSSALELMGERDEELEELRADIIDLKEMYREQIDLLVNKLQKMGASTGVD